jgi:rod shape-determining protein MreC
LGVRLLVLAVLSVALMVVDARFTLLKPVRSQISLVLMESYWITDLPQRLWQGVASQFGSRTELVAENEKLKTENLLLQGRMQKLAALTEQNVRLRELLNSSALVNEKVEVAELIGMDPNPFTHRIIINKGERDGVVLGQPVLDARGLMGQVVELMPYTSRVLLLTDTTQHSRAGQPQWPAGDCQRHRQPGTPGAAARGRYRRHQGRRPAGQLRPRPAVPGRLSGGDGQGSHP